MSPVRIPVELVRFEAADGLGLHGLFADAPSEIAAVYVHEIRGNSLVDPFVDHLREAFLEHGIAFLTFDDRTSGACAANLGHGVQLPGVTARCAEDVEGAIALCRSLGKRSIILVAHGNGYVKLARHLDAGGPELAAVLLLAPAGSSSLTRPAGSCRIPTTAINASSGFELERCELVEIAGADPLFSGRERDLAFEVEVAVSNMLEESLEVLA